MDRKTDYTKVFLKESGIDPNDENVKKFIPEWWYNIRSKDSGGLRLTDQGLEFLENNLQLKIYDITLPKEVKFTPQLLVWLDNYIEGPYYITKNTIKVLKEKSALEIYLFSGDIKKMGYAKSMSKRLNSEFSIP
jgi:hypothetical protein